jgi:type IV pilus assembly protein PilN
LVCITCGALYAQKRSAIKAVEAEIAEIDHKNRMLREKIGQVRDFEQKQAELEKKLAVLKELKAGKSGPVHLLDELSSALPEELWLTKFSEKSGSIDIAGIADTENRVAEFMERLDGSPYYQDIELQVTQQSKVGDMKMQQFTLRGKVQKPSAK